MKIILVSLAAFAAFALVPVASQASDKEAVKCRCINHAKQVAFTGHDRATPLMQTVTQVGQGQSVTFYAGQR